MGFNNKHFLKFNNEFSTKNFLYKLRATNIRKNNNNKENNNNKKNNYKKDHDNLSNNKRLFRDIYKVNNCLSTNNQSSKNILFTIINKISCNYFYSRFCNIYHNKDQ